MRRLHRWNDPKRFETRDVLRAKNLRMFDAQPVVVSRNGAQRGFVRIQDGSIAAIADGVHAGLESVRERARRNVRDVALRDAKETAVGGIVGVGLQERGAA